MITVVDNLNAVCTTTAIKMRGIWFLEGECVNKYLNERGVG